MYKLTLADGTVVEFAGMNGDNFIASEEMDTSVFTDENLKTCTFTDEDGNEYPCENLEFMQQMKWQTGEYYLSFCQKTKAQVEMAEMYDLLVDLAEIEVGEGNLELENIPSGMQDAVRVKLDDSKWKDR